LAMGQHRIKQRDALIEEENAAWTQQAFLNFGTPSRVTLQP